APPTNSRGSIEKAWQRLALSRSTSLANSLAELRFRSAPPPMRAKARRHVCQVRSSDARRRPNLAPRPRRRDGSRHGSGDVVDFAALSRAWLTERHAASVRTTTIRTATPCSVTVDRVSCHNACSHVERRCTRRHGAHPGCNGQRFLVCGEIGLPYFPSPTGLLVWTTRSSRKKWHVWKNSSRSVK